MAVGRYISAEAVLVWQIAMLVGADIAFARSSSAQVSTSATLESLSWLRAFLRSQTATQVVDRLSRQVSLPSSVRDRLDLAWRLFPAASPR
jgi:hypothetical protein